MTLLYAIGAKKQELRLADQKCEQSIDSTKNQARAKGAPEFHFYTWQKINRENDHGGINDERWNPHSKNSQWESEHFD